MVGIQSPGLPAALEGVLKIACKWCGRYEGWTDPCYLGNPVFPHGTPEFHMVKLAYGVTVLFLYVLTWHSVLHLDRGDRPIRMSQGYPATPPHRRSTDCLPSDDQPRSDENGGLFSPDGPVGSHFCTSAVQIHHSPRED